MLAAAWGWGVGSMTQKNNISYRRVKGEADRHEKSILEETGFAGGRIWCRRIGGDGVFPSGTGLVLGGISGERVPGRCV